MHHNPQDHALSTQAPGMPVTSDAQHSLLHAWQSPPALCPQHTAVHLNSPAPSSLCSNLTPAASLPALKLLLALK
jgi:hypothetical protein